MPNSSFEILNNTCPTISGYIDHAQSWNNPTLTSPDYFNSCITNIPITASTSVPVNSFGFQFAHTGNAYAGIYTINLPNVNVREYIQSELLDTLDIGKNYCISFYVSCADQYQFNTAITEIGLYISNNAITSSTYYNFNVSPQITSPPGVYLNDTVNWYKVEGTYTALGGERYITIGNFKTDALTDTICWNLNDTNCAPNCFPNAYYYIDDVSVMDCNDTSTSINEVEINYHFNLYPNPNDGRMNFVYDLLASETGEFVIYDISGRIIQSYKLQIGNNNQLFIDESKLGSGIYFYKVLINEQIEKSDKLIIIK